LPGALAEEVAPHSEADAESSLDPSGHAEAAGEVEAFRMRIANDVEKAGRLHASHVGNVVDETPSDAVLPEVRLDEQGVQLGTTIGTRYHRRKAGDDSIAFCNEDPSSRNLLDRQGDRVRVRQERIAIPGIGK
jgi:hypothetical protein